MRCNRRAVFFWVWATQLPLDDLDTFVLVDASFSVRKFQRWSELVPRVKPHLGMWFLSSA